MGFLVFLIALEEIRFPSDGFEQDLCDIVTVFDHHAAGKTQRRRRRRGLNPRCNFEVEVICTLLRFVDRRK